MKQYKIGALFLATFALFACKDEQVVTKSSAETTEQQQAVEASTIPLISAEPTTLIQEKKCFKDERCYEIDMKGLKTNVDWIDHYFQTQAREYLIPEDSGLSPEEADKAKAHWQQLSFEQLKAEYIKSIADLFNDPEYAPIGYAFEYQPRFIAQHQQLAMFVDYFSLYSGGAHGIYGTRFSNFDLQTKKLLKLDDILLPNQQLKFNELLQNAFLYYLSTVENEQSLEKLQQLLQERESMGWKLVPTDNFTFTYEGVLFNYRPYELGAYAEGEIQLLIPYNALIGVAKPSYLFNTTKSIISE
ncbi:RsiV family protein [Gallibacterium trehalosifermentans]|uniref:RsiV family protein n=1 Tax=Gallibacterium trehalosifermentans TaxID=516935 RepID=A0ABV6GY08_9PAST